MQFLQIYEKRFICTYCLFYFESFQLLIKFVKIYIHELYT